MFLQFFGLNEQPFGVTPDPRFLYMGAAHQEAFASLVYGVETGRGFMALIAGPGLGKTTLIHHLMERLRDSARTAFLFQSQTNPQDFLRSLIRDLGVEPAGQAFSDLQEQLHQMLVMGANSGQRVVVVIDEAQNLNDSLLEAVRMLSNFETAKSKLLQVVLVGQPGLADKLLRPHLAQLRQRISIITHFPPFQGSDIEKYILHRLRVAGYQGGRLFSAEAIALIARYSGGVPRIINNLCFSALSLAYAKGQKGIDESAVREAIADLNLESLRDRCGLARLETEQRAPVQKAGNGIAEDPTALPFPGTTIGSRDLETGPLDGVVFSDYPPRSMGDSASRPVFASLYAADPGPQHKLRTGILVLLALAVVSVCIWRAAWLKPSLAFFEEAFSSAADKLQGKQRMSASNPPDDRQSTPSSSVPQPGGLNPIGSIRQPDRSESSNLSIPADPSAKAPAISALARTAAAPVASTGAFVAENTSPAAVPMRQVRERTTPPLNLGNSADDMGAPGAHGELVVQSKVRGATISLNGHTKPDWVTPHLFTLTAGTYILSVSKVGYSTWTGRVHVDEKRENWVSADLEYEQGDGILIVDTDPTGMQVFVDGKPYGVSNMETLLRPGWHVCEIVPGEGLQPVKRQFHLDPGEAVTRRIRLASAATTDATAAPPKASSAGANIIHVNSRGEHLE